MDNLFRVLIAEDNPVSRMILEKNLIKAGHDVISAQDGLEALEIFRKDFFPIVVTDWMMPKMSGLELCKAIRRDTSKKGYVYIVLVTGRDSKEDIIKGFEAGADDYLTKPFNKAELFARLNTGRRILELEKSLKRANEEIKILSITDPLTGAYNREYLNEHLPREIQRALRYGQPLSIALADLDHFKGVNDKYGHQAGDEVLKSFVRKINKGIRENVDWVSRYGGEEFLVVLPATSLKNAIKVSERLRKLISHKPVNFNGNKIGVTVSFGVTSIGPGNTQKKRSAEGLLMQSDKYLYKAKNNGRNMVKGGNFESAR